ncbi:MAG: DegT/DnrJ/EryC1/StrS family aminotransferase [Planctomycetes bacterium]|nr:DegT/DnrJ/EryC1/StrS family aminotransferase [Planctomycetota bacterium]
MDTSNLKTALEAAWKESAPRPFDPSNPVVKLHEATYDAEEIWEVLQCLLKTEVTLGPKVRKFEQEFAARFGHRHAVMVNSGSSANLLAVAGLADDATADRLKPGDEVIVPALCWSTTVWPLIQHQLVPVIVDPDLRTLNLDPAGIARAIGPKTRAIMPVPIYGNPCDMDAILEIAKKHNLTVLEDSCESLGATYGGRHVGSFGRAGTFSFYYSHHITTLEGGMVVTDDFELAETMRALRAHGWTREMERPKKHLDANPDIHAKFLFVNLGYNLRATEPQAAMGSAQLRKLDRFIRIRADNAQYWLKELASLSEFFDFVSVTPRGNSSWFGFPMRVKPGAPFTARELMGHLQSRGIEMRPLNAGNIAVQPAIKRHPHRVVGDLPHANDIMKNGFTFGNHQHVDAAARAYVADTLKSFVAGRRTK